jgi:hypothetical protein
MDLRWKHPFTAIVAGPSGSGKSYFVKRFMNNLNEICDTEFENIYWYHPAGFTLSDGNDSSTNIIYKEGLPDTTDFDGLMPNLVVVDDMMRETDSNVVDLFTKGSHHSNLSVFFITQNLFHQGKGQRDISLNAHYIVLFKNPRDRAQIKHLARQVYPQDSKFIEEAYEDATRSAHGYLLLDLKQSTPDELRVRTCVLPDESAYQYVYQPLTVRKRR